MDVRSSALQGSLEPTIFHEPWWLHAAHGSTVEEAQYYIDGKLVGRFPYVCRKSGLNRTVCRAPEYTNVLGPAIDEGRGSESNKALRRDTIIRELLSQMPRTSGMSQTINYDIENLIVFQEAGFQISAQFTYTISPSPLDVVWMSMRDKTRNIIRGAQKSLTVVEMRDVDRFVDMYETNIRLSGYQNVFDLRSLARLEAACIERNRGRIISAVREDGYVEAAIFYVWDARRAYYLVSTRRRDAHNGATSLLIWAAIQDCSRRTLIFDFDGVATQGGRLFYTGFGGKTAHRFTVSRFTRYHRMVDTMERNILPRSRSKYFA